MANDYGKGEYHGLVPLVYDEVAGDIAGINLGKTEYHGLVGLVYSILGWLPGFNWRTPITANTSALTTTEVNVPLPVFLPTLTGKRLQAAWQDVNFTDVDGTTLLDWYLEVKSDTVGVAHVEVPTLTFGNAALPVGYLYTGNAAVADQSDEAGTFSKIGRASCRERV